MQAKKGPVQIESAIGTLRVLSVVVAKRHPIRLVRISLWMHSRHSQKAITILWAHNQWLKNQGQAPPGAWTTPDGPPRHPRRVRTSQHTHIGQGGQGVILMCSGQSTKGIQELHHDKPLMVAQVSTLSSSGMTQIQMLCSDDHLRDPEWEPPDERHGLEDKDPTQGSNALNAMTSSLEIYIPSLVSFAHLEPQSGTCHRPYSPHCCRQVDGRMSENPPDMIAEAPTQQIHVGRLCCSTERIGRYRGGTSARTLQSSCQDPAPDHTNSMATSDYGGGTINFFPRSAAD